MGCAAEIIALDDVRATQQRQALRQHLPERFDQWLDEVDAQLSASDATLAQVSETIWSLRQGLTASVAQTIIEQAHQEERNRKALRCTTCDRLVSARATRVSYRTHVGGRPRDRETLLLVSILPGRDRAARYGVGLECGTDSTRCSTGGSRPRHRNAV